MNLAHLIHHQLCEYCKHREVFKKALEGKYELERCKLTGKTLPRPFQGPRWCDRYQQINCNCEQCNI